MLSEYISEAERYQEERYGTSFCIKDGGRYVVKQCTPQEAEAFARNNEAYAVTYVKVDADADQTPSVPRPLPELFALGWNGERSTQRAVAAEMKKRKSHGLLKKILLTALDCFMGFCAGLGGLS